MKTNYTGSSERLFKRLIYQLCLAWWRLKQWLRALFVPRREIVRWEALADAAYDKMYDAKYYEARECYDEAFQCLQEAIKIARAHKMDKEVARLRARQDHIYNVYSHQFR
jgi:tetratricopeptide (TPR) repeat protein